MHYQFLIEDASSATLIDLLMQKIIHYEQSDYEPITYDCKSFHGMGGFTKKNTVKETKSGKLLNDLATYLRGFSKKLQHIPAVVIIVLDNDSRDTEQFYKELNDVATKNSISVDYVFCIAVEEVEAWFLGDTDAIATAYPSVKYNVLNSYIQDSICGTWELLADAIYPGGYSKMKKDCISFVDIGLVKNEWSQNIGVHMDIHKNKSPSFCRFIDEVYKRLPSGC